MDIGVGNKQGKSRVYGENASVVEFGCIKEIYAFRAKNSSNALNAVMLQEDSSELPHFRNEFEADVLDRTIDFESKNILDVGCGAGRVAGIIPSNIESYTGIDFSEELLDIANKKFANEGKYKFICDDLKIKHSSLSSLDSKFDVIFIAGLFMYYNDEEISITLGNIKSLLNDKCTIYLRESISIMGERLTLNEFYSEKLQSSYSSIYRTEQEYLELLKPLTNNSFKLVETEFFPDELATNKETNLKYFVFKR